MLLDQALGKTDDREVNNFLAVLNTTQAIANQYYRIRDFWQVAVQVRDKYRSEDSFYATPELNTTRTQMQARTRKFQEDLARRQFEEERLSEQRAEVEKKKKEREELERAEREALITSREMTRPVKEKVAVASTVDAMEDLLAKSYKNTVGKRR